MTRRTKLTNRVIEDYCAARQIGATQTVAALYAGVSKSAITLWTNRALELRQAKDKGEEIQPKDRIFLTFLNKVEESDAGAAIEWLEVIQKAAATDATWAWRLLKQRYPDEYQERSNLDVTTGGHPIVQIITGIPEDAI